MTRIHITPARSSDSSLSSSLSVDVPGDVPVQSWIAKLARALDLPLSDSSGLPITYALYHNEVVLSPEQSLNQAGVGEGDDLSIWLAAEETEVGVVHFSVAGQWTTRDLADWLKRIDSAYSRLDLFLNEQLEELVLRALARTPPSLIRDADQGFEDISSAARLRSGELRVKKIAIASPGFVELIGNLNPLKVVADFILAWRHENTIRDQISLQAELDRLKVKSELARILLERENTLRERANNDDLVDRFVRFVLDEPQVMLAEVARDVRLSEVTFREIQTSDQRRSRADQSRVGHGNAEGTGRTPAQTAGQGTTPSPRAD